MPSSSICVFSEPDDFAAVLRDGGYLELLVIDRGSFRARFTRVALHHLRISAAEEHQSRIALIALPPGVVRISWPTIQDAPLVGAGIRVRSGDILTQSSDERAHERLDGACYWRDIQIPAKHLIEYGQALINERFQIPTGTHRWRPLAGAFKRLTGLHAAAIRRVEGRPVATIEAEAAHGLEQELIHALIDCLSAAPTNDDPRTTRRHADIMARFEDTLRAHPNQALSLTEICAAVAVPAHTLRACCAGYLGMGPCAYHRLRRLHLVHRALSKADRNKSSISQVAQHYGFNDPSRFAKAYQTRFGELPSATLQRHRSGNLHSHSRR